MVIVQCRSSSWKQAKVKRTVQHLGMLGLTCEASCQALHDSVYSKVHFAQWFIFWYKAGELVVQLNLYLHKVELTQAAWLAVCGSYLLFTSHKLLHYPWLGNMGKYSALGLCIVPPFGRANTATLELNISSYCPPCSAIIIIYLFIACIAGYTV